MKLLPTVGISYIKGSDKATAARRAGNSQHFNHRGRVA